jgi:hypothetical protein
MSYTIDDAAGDSEGTGKLNLCSNHGYQDLNICKDIKQQPA